MNGSPEGISLSGRAPRELRLLELLHAAPGNLEASLRFLEALQTAISPDCVAVVASDAHETRRGIIAGPALGVSRIAVGDFMRRGITEPSAAELPTGGVLDIPPNSPGLQPSQLFREVLAPAGILPAPGLVVVLDRTDLGITAVTMVLARSERWKPRPADRALLEWLAPHLVISRRLDRLVNERLLEGQALLSAFDRLVLGVVFTDEAGRVSYANRSAAELLGTQPGFTNPSTLRSVVPDERTRAWRRLLVGAPEDRRALVVAHPGDGRTLQILATPLAWSAQEMLYSTYYARAFFVADPKQRSGDPVLVLRELFGLTPSETRLALLLAADCSLDEAAERLGIQRSTARGVLKTIFSKTGTNRQASLVRLLLGGPGGLVRSALGTGGPSAAPAQDAGPLRRGRR